VGGVTVSNRGCIVTIKMFLVLYPQLMEQRLLALCATPGQPIYAGLLLTLEACWTLGIPLAPDGNNIDKQCYLLEVAKQWQTSMAAAKVAHLAAKFGLCQVILCKLEYPLVATNFIQTQCNDIMQPILSARLPLAGLACTFPRAIVHGPWQWGGLNPQPLHRTNFNSPPYHNEAWRPTTRCDRESPSALVQGYIMIGNIFEFSECIYSYLTLTWLTHTWE